MQPPKAITPAAAASIADYALGYTLASVLGKHPRPCRWKSFRVRSTLLTFPLGRAPSYAFSRPISPPLP